MIIITPTSECSPASRVQSRSGDKRVNKLSAAAAAALGAAAEPLYSSHYYRGNNVSALAAGHSS